MILVFVIVKSPLDVRMDPLKITTADPSRTSNRAAVPVAEAFVVVIAAAVMLPEDGEPNGDADIGSETRTPVAPERPDVPMTRTPLEPMAAATAEQIALRVGVPCVIAIFYAS